MASRNLEDWLTTYLEYVDESEPPTLFKVWSGISAICSALKRKCYTQWEKVIYPNMYIVLVGPSGCRKGTAMYYTQDLLSALGIKMSSQSITREALIQTLEECGELPGYEVNGKVNLQVHSSLTIFSQELTVFLGQHNWEMISALCNWYDCEDPWTYKTKHQGENQINGIWVNLFGATTPEFLQSSLPQDAIGGGLTSRIVFVYGDKKSKIIALPKVTNRERELREMLRDDLNEIHMLHGEFIRTPEYDEAYKEWYELQESGQGTQIADEQFAGYNQRRATHIRKMSMALCASRSSNMNMRAIDFHRAVKILETTERAMVQAFAGRGKSNIAAVLEKVMRILAVDGHISRQEILERFYRDIDSMAADKIVTTLCHMGFAKMSIQGTDVLLTHKRKKDEPRGSAGAAGEQEAGTGSS